MIACPEEICWRRGWIDNAQIRALGDELNKTAYGRYLIQLSEEGR